MLISGGSAPVGVIGKVLRILELLDQFPDGLQLKDVAAKTGINGGFLNLRG